MRANRLNYAKPSRSPRWASDSAAMLEAKAWFDSNRLLICLVAMGVLVGFIHGWLKITIRSSATTFAFDLFFIWAFFSIVMKQGWKNLLGGTKEVSGPLKAFLVMCVFYALAPWGPSPLISLASLRGWCFAPLMFVVGYVLFLRPIHFRCLAVLVIALCIFTGAYGLTQSYDEVLEIMKSDPWFAARYKGTFYYAEGADLQLRIFSTFVSSGGFGGAIAFGNVLLFGLFLKNEKVQAKKIALVVVYGFLAYVVFRTGSRTSLISMALGTMIVAMSRRGVGILLPLIIVVGLALGVAASKTEGLTTKRFVEGLGVDEVLFRNTFPLMGGLDRLRENPVGSGLGRSTHGVPFFLMNRLGNETYYQIDGDIGRLMVDMGIPGVVCFAWLLKSVIAFSYRIARETNEREVGDLAAVVLGLLVVAAISLPSGSPFLGVPNGVLTWLSVGALCRNVEHLNEPALRGGIRQRLKARLAI